MDPGALRRVLMLYAVMLLLIGLTAGWLVRWIVAPDAPCYEMRRLSEADTFTVCGDAVETYLESGCCHVLGREERE